MFAIALVSWVLLQMVILKVQESYPRFLIPRSMRHILLAGPDYHQYEQTFKSSSGALLQDSSRVTDSEVGNLENRTKSLTERLTPNETLLREKECSICLSPLGFRPNSNEVLNSYLMTPCKH